MTAAVHLPPGPRWPVALQGIAYIASRRRLMLALGKRYGSVFTVRLPFFGPTVMISDPALVKQFFQTRTDVVRNVEPNLDLVLGPGSTFGLQDEEHRRRRKLLVPPFHGKRMRAYEDLVEQETLKEIATWPEGSEFPVLPSTMRITLNVILRAVFGADRFLTTSPDMYAWVPFGGGTRRCLGAAFANMEMNVVLRTILREFRYVPTTSRDERLHSRGVAFAPSAGGRAVVYRRIPGAAAAVDEQRPAAVAG